MKTKRLISPLLWILTIFIVGSCVKEDDFSTPDTAINPPEITGDTISVYDVKAALAQEANRSFNFKGDEQYTFKGPDKYMVGYVTSSDEGGNFYQELILQDKPENPTTGIKLMIAKDPLFTQYEIGRKVYVELNGFTVGFSNGVMALGIPKSGSDYIEKAPMVFEDKIIRSREKKTIIPLQLGISDFTEGKYDNLYIQLDSMQFPEVLVKDGTPRTFAGEPEDGYDALRLMGSCSGESTYLSTSTFADYKFLALPQKRGRIEGILSKNFEGDTYVIKLNDPSAVHFDRERCTRDSSDDPEPGVPAGPGDPNENRTPDPPDLENAGLAFPGADFEDWPAFRTGLVGSGLKSYATESPENGREGSTALKLSTDPQTTSGNDYIFITRTGEEVPPSPNRLTFYLKGTADKSLSLNLYTADEKVYYSFNLKDISTSSIIEPSGSNRYAGTIDTNGEWVLISLDLSQVEDLNTVNPSGKFLALKIGKEANYNVFLDNFRME